MSKKYVLRDIGEIYDGPHATPKRQTEGKYFLNISSLDNGRLQLRKSDHISDIDYEKWTRRITPQANDLLFSYETRLGEAALMPGGIKAALGRRMALLRPDTSKVDPGFLLYKWLSPQWQALISERTLHGATVNRIPIRDIPDWPITLPPLSQQNAIASILRSLDDKIAGNNKMIRIILELQKSIWIQNNVKNLSQIHLINIAEPILGGTPKRSDNSLWNGDILWASVADMTSVSNSHLLTTAEQITEKAAETKRFAPLPAGSVLLSARGTVGHVISLATPAAFNQSAYGFIAPKGYETALRFAIEDTVEELKSKSYGSVFSTITKQQINECLIPDVFNESFAELHAKLNSLETRVVIAEQENQTLARTRDELLPLLMSGKITVRDAEEASAEVGVDKHEVEE